MSKCNELVCDLCEQHIKHEDGVYNGRRFSLIKFKVKEFWHSFHESGWGKKTIHICPRCQAKIIQLLRSDNNA